jgi:transposase
VNFPQFNGHSIKGYHGREECSMSKRAYKTYTREFKVEAVRLAAESDKPVTQVARELGLRVNQIYKWRQQ